MGHNRKPEQLQAKRKAIVQRLEKSVGLSENAMIVHVEDLKPRGLFYQAEWILHVFELISSVIFRPFGHYRRSVDVEASDEGNIGERMPVRSCSKGKVE